MELIKTSEIPGHLAYPEYQIEWCFKLKDTIFTTLMRCLNSVPWLTTKITNYEKSLKIKHCSIFINKSNSSLWWKNLKTIIPTRLPWLHIYAFICIYNTVRNSCFSLCHGNAPILLCIKASLPGASKANWKCMHLNLACLLNEWYYMSSCLLSFEL